MSKARDLADSVAAGSVLADGVVSLSEIGSASGVNLSFVDNSKAIFGAGSDLQIYHDGSNSYIDDAGAGRLNIRSNDLRIEKYTGETIAKFIADGAVELNYNDSIKLATTATGIDVTGLTDTDTLNVSGNVTLGDASTDTVTVNGYMGVGGAGALDSAAGLKVTSSALQGAGQVGIWSEPTVTSGSTTNAWAYRAQIKTAAASFTVGQAFGLRVVNPSLGAGSAITTNAGVRVDDMTAGGTNYGFESSVSSGTNKWNIYASGTAANYFAGNVGIGTNSPATTIHLRGVGGGVATFQDAISSATARIGVIGTGGNLTYDSNTGGSHKFEIGGSEQMRLTSTGLGIGTSSPFGKLHTAGGNVLIGLNAASTDILYINGGGMVSSNGASSALKFGIDGTERMRLDSVGNLGLGVTPSGWNSSAKALQLNTTGSFWGVGGQSRVGNNHYFDSGSTFRYLTTGAIATDFSQTSSGFFWNIAPSGTAGAAITFNQAMTLDASGRLLIGTSSATAGTRLEIADSSDNAFTAVLWGADKSTEYFAFGVAGAGESRITAGGAGTTSNAITFHTAASGVEAERARITSDGSLLVGTTDQSLYNNGAGGGVGVGLNPSGYLQAARSNSNPLLLNRLDSDGVIADFRKDGVVVGSIGSISSSGSQLRIGDTSTGLCFRDDLVAIIPANSTSLVDNTTDLGNSSFRFDDIYATNGTIQTSDRNEKQDIEALSEAEARVAVACKGLLRKFRWKDSVAEKGDEARIHFGIIAQDLQAAFAAEGLDAGRYAMFISSTWTDEETGEERTRLGVRYPELLAFIIAAI